MINRWFKIAAFFMMLGVLLGAFGAHALKMRLSPEALEIYQTAVSYQFIHAIALFIVAYVVSTQKRSVILAGYCFVGGILIFSGSLYFLSLTGIKWIGALTPIGGVLFVAGWALLAFGV